MWRRCFFVVILTLLSSFVPTLEGRLTAEEDPVGNATVCEGVLTNWLLNNEPSLVSENATLIVDWSSLETQLVAKKCTYENLYLELWRVVGSPSAKRPQDFGTLEYFDNYERCNKLEPEHFRHHDTKAKPVENKDKGGNVAMFTHVVENEYVLRLCPCRRRRHQRVCDCEYDHGDSKTHCSEVFKLKQGPKARVLPWCIANDRQEPRSAHLTGHNGYYLPTTTTTMASKVDTGVAEVIVKSFLINCTHALISGTMPSCTPIQRYDRVRLSFHKMDNKTTPECWQHKDLGTSDPIFVSARLDPNSTFTTDGEVDDNAGTGEFSVIVGLHNDSSYCLQIEYVDHPYCSRNLVVDNVESQPKICSVHVSKPIPTAVCKSRGYRPPPPPGDDNFPFWMEKLFLGVCLGIMCILILILAFCIKNRIKSRVKGVPRDTLAGVYETPIIKPNAKVFGYPMERSPFGQPRLKIFLLHFAGSHGEEDLRCRLMREWLLTFASQVYDLNDDTFDESINADPEGWIMRILQESDVKVILVTSVTAACILRPSATKGPSCTTSSTGVSSTGSVSSSGTISSRKSISTPNKTTKRGEDEVDPGGEGGTPVEPPTKYDTDAELKVSLLHAQDSIVSDEFDPRRELRVFALKQVQSHYTGNYRQLSVVSFDSHSHSHVVDRDSGTASSSSNPETATGSETGSHHLHGAVGKEADETLLLVSDVISSALTPNKGALVLPHHFNELKDWLQVPRPQHRDAGNNSNISKGGLLSTKRLSALTSSHSHNKYMYNSSSSATRGRVPLTDYRLVTSTLDGTAGDEIDSVTAESLAEKRLFEVLTSSSI